MRMIRFAAALLLLAGCFGPSERERPTGGTGGGGFETEPDAAPGGGGGQGDEGGAGGAPAEDSGAGGSGRDADTRKDDARPPDTGVPADAAVDRAAGPRDTSAPRDGVALAPDVSARDAPTASDGLAGDPEPGRLAGITRFHNQVRASIPVPPLTWDPTLAASAAAYAAQCMFQHSGTKGVGENLAAYAPPGGQKANAPVDDWAGEAADYDYATNSCAPGKECGHYTQLVWKSSQRVGCAVQTCSQNTPFGAKFPDWDLWVCQYAPPGNFVGQRPY
jgi:uncharacterized protein YkwD